jgi:hypothetical protein
VKGAWPQPSGGVGGHGIPDSPHTPPTATTDHGPIPRNRRETMVLSGAHGGTTAWPSSPPLHATNSPLQQPHTPPPLNVGSGSMSPHVLNRPLLSGTASGSPISNRAAARRSGGSPGLYKLASSLPNALPSDESFNVINNNHNDSTRPTATSPPPIGSTASQHHIVSATLSASPASSPPPIIPGLPPVRIPNGSSNGPITTNAMNPSSSAVSPTTHDSMTTPTYGGSVTLRNRIDRFHAATAGGSTIHISATASPPTMLTATGGGGHTTRGSVASMSDLPDSRGSGGITDRP